MKSRKLLLWFSATILALAGCGAPCRAGELAIVRDGKAAHLVHPEESFEIESEGGCVVLRDRWQTFLVNARPGDEFTLKIRMAVEKTLRSAATVVLVQGEDDSNFGFSGSKEMMFAQGKAFTRDTFTAINARATPQFILDGDMFDFVMTWRKTGPGKGDLDITINGESFVHQSGKCPAIDAVGLRPWTGVIRIESMTLSGSFEEGGVTPKRFEPPAKK